MIKINLVPQEVLDKELQKQRSKQLVAGFAVLAAMGVTVSISHYYKAVRLAEELEMHEAKYKKLQEIVAEVEELERQAQLARAHLAVIKDLLTGRPLYPRFMEDLQTSLATSVWLTNLSTSADGNGLKVTMTAKARSNEDVAQWLRTLENSERFKEPVLGAISSDSEGVRSFTMAARYVPAAEPRP